MSKAASSVQPFVVTREDSSLAEHLIRLRGSDEWALWRCVALRGAGFPVAGVLELASPECASAADHLIASEEKAEGAHRASVEALRRDLTSSTDEEARATTSKFLQSLLKGKMKAGVSYSGPAAAALEDYRASLDEVAAARGDFERKFEAAMARISPAIQRLIRDERFREALTWQNRQALHGSLGALMHASPNAGSRNAERRRREELAANYLQRYCTKNDTIGFFGPVGWATFGTQAEAIVVRPGQSMTATREVYFEVWCIDALGKALSQDTALRPWLAPRRVPATPTDGSNFYTLHRLTPSEHAALKACDGERTAKGIARSLIDEAHSAVRDEGDAYRLLEGLEHKNLIVWTMEVPVDLHPEKFLRRALERIGDEPLRRRCLGALDELEDARRAVAAAAGDAQELDGALARLEEVFTRLTGVAPTRSAGKMYAGRTLVYEDCRRDLEVRLGERLLETLGPPLSFMLTAARWFVHEVASAYRQLFRRLYAEHVRRSGSSVMELSHLWMLSQPYLFNEDKSPLGDLLSNFQRRWAELLPFDSGERRVEFKSEDLRAELERKFAAPDAGWISACYQNPDVMLAASGLDAIERGDYLWVMGELHISANPIGVPLFMMHHPSPESFLEAANRDMSEPRLIPVIPKAWFDSNARLIPILSTAKDYRVVLTPEPHDVPRSQVVPIGGLVVEETGGRLVVRTRDGRVQFDLIEAFADVLRSQAANFFKIFPRRKHTPRVTIDNLVIQREAWSFSPSEIPFLDEGSEASQFVAARRWAADERLPRFVFVKTSTEVKPFFMDFASPVYVSAFVRAVRREAKGELPNPLVNMSEMLPLPEQTWLPDAEDKKYTCELRIAAVDLKSSNRPRNV
jgi:hypothetical protein